MNTTMKRTTRFAAVMCWSAMLVAGLGCASEGGSEREEASTASARQVAAKKAEPSSKAHPLPGDPEEGKAIYEKHCLACHQKDGRGNGGITGANFVDDPSRLAKSNEALLESIREGVTGGTAVMPPHKDRLTETQMKDALSYVRAEFGRSE